MSESFFYNNNLSFLKGKIGILNRKVTNRIGNSIEAGSEVLILDKNNDYGFELVSVKSKTRIKNVCFQLVNLKNIDNE